MITRVLSRAEERDTAGQVGRPKDMHAEMQRVAAIFGTELDNATKAFDAQEQPDKAIGVGIHEALQHQKEKAESMRQHQEEDVPAFMPDEDAMRAEVQLLTEEIPSSLWLAICWHPGLAIAIAKANWDHLAYGSWTPGWIPRLFPNL